MQVLIGAHESKVNDILEDIRGHGRQYTIESYNDRNGIRTG